ncbi:MAG: pyruvate carboxylase [Helicobacteraceae bacterium CG2_30_36_10]|nr:MAG: pyruvate carboxylase [Helicobacteraceae bacterium CG2_30_36_10]
MDTNLVVEGLKFMALGMGTVFAFLIILIAVMYAMSAIIHKFFPEPQPNMETNQAGTQDNKKIIAAISAAITHHRKG